LSKRPPLYGPPTFNEKPLSRNGLSSWDQYRRWGADPEDNITVGSW
jgi:hypothetical protein